MPAFPNISDVLFGQNSPMASPPMAQMLPPANTPPVPGPAQPSMPVAAQQPQSNDLDQLVKQLTAAYTKQVIQANQGNLGQDKNLFLPNTGFFGNHPNLSRAIESGMTAASMVQPSSTTGGAIGQTAAALLGMPGALAQAKFQRSALPMQQTGQLLQGLQGVQQGQSALTTAAVQRQKLQSDIAYQQSEIGWRHAQEDYYSKRGDYYDKLYGKNQWEPYPYPSTDETGVHPVLLDKNTGKYHVETDINLAPKPTAAKPPARASAVRQYIDRNLPAAAKSMGLDPESLSDEDRAKVENNLEFEYRRKNADINAIARGTVPGYLPPNIKERINVLQTQLKGMPLAGSSQYQMMDPAAQRTLDEQRKELDALSTLDKQSGGAAAKPSALDQLLNQWQKESGGGLPTPSGKPISALPANPFTPDAQAQILASRGPTTVEQQIANEKLRNQRARENQLNQYSLPGLFLGTF